MMSRAADSQECGLTQSSILFLILTFILLWQEPAVPSPPGAALVLICN